MLTIISPSKTLDYDSARLTNSYSLPIFIKDSQVLMKDCKKLTADNLTSLMSISPNLAELNYQRFQNWQPDFNLKNAKQAILAFKGDVYEGINVDDFTENDFQFAQSHLRILSGLYGLLRPLDLIQPYRLEMGIRLKNGKNSNLYQFWGETLTEQMNDELQNDAQSIVINLASNEYFKAIKPKKLKATIIQPIFLDEKNGEYKMISFYAKKARGLMSRFIIKNNINHCQDIKNFNLDGYQFDIKRSTELQWVFTRSH